MVAAFCRRFAATCHDRSQGPSGSPIRQLRKPAGSAPIIGLRLVSGPEGHGKDPHYGRKPRLPRQREGTTSAEETGWWWTQSAENPSRPALQGKNREFQQICVCWDGFCVRSPRELKDLQTNSLSQGTGNSLPWSRVFVAAISDRSLTIRREPPLASCGRNAIDIVAIAPWGLKPLRSARESRSWNVHRTSVERPGSAEQENTGGEGE